MTLQLIVGAGPVGSATAVRLAGPPSGHGRPRCPTHWPPRWRGGDGKAAPRPDNSY
jgi:hypothetical protein